MEPTPQASRRDTIALWSVGLLIFGAIFWFVNRNGFDQQRSGPADPGPLNVQRPEPGKLHKHNPGEIRYCLAEEIRIEAARAVIIDVYRDDFDKAVTDYNSRCSSFQYDKREFSAARRHVDFFKRQLQKEGRARMGKE